MPVSAVRNRSTFQANSSFQHSWYVADVSGRGLAPGAIETVDKGVQLSAISDPDGNTITFIGDFRVQY